MRHNRRRRTEPPKRGILPFLGAILFLIGLGALLYYWQFFDTTVGTQSVEILGQRIGGGRVHNIGLLQDRQNGMILGAAAAILGFVCVAIAQKKKQ